MNESTDDVLAELARYDEQFQPAAFDVEAGLDTLANGDYQLEILAAELTRTPQTREAIFRLKLKVLAGPSAVGAVIERVNFFNRQESVNILGGDLVALGIPADQWCRAYGKAFAAEFGKILPRLPGIRFAGRKTSKRVGEGPGATVYHNLYVRGKLPAGLGAAPTRPGRAPAPAPLTEAPNENDIPF